MKLFRLAAAVCVSALLAATLFGQEPQAPSQLDQGAPAGQLEPGTLPPGEPAPGQRPLAQPLNPAQLQNLVAPIALYPDTLLSQILVASTYPIEVVEAQQWLQQHRDWKGQKLLDEAKKQNWDPSVQALVAFPDVLTRLNMDIRWTTDLGNAFLAQQPDVMSAVQQLRAKAQANGKLQSTPQENVTTQTENGQTAIDIQPADPGVIYVPYYNPAWVWGPPLYGYYPPLFYPGIDVGFGFFPGIDVGLYFGGGWGLWGGFGWGWGPDWFGGRILLDDHFFHRYGFRDYHPGLGGVWAHDPGHRLGVPYSNRAVANRFGGSAGFRGAGNFRGGDAFRGSETPRAGEGFRGAEAPRGGEGGRGAEAPRGGEGFRGAEAPGGGQGFRGAEAPRGGNGFSGRSAAPAPHFSEPDRNFGGHSAFGGVQNGGVTRMQSDHGFSSMGRAGFGGGGGGGFHGGGGRR
jgi:hypothetical protein